MLIFNMAEAPSNYLPSGFEEEFVNAVDDENLCLICHLPLKEPALTRCGHRFCKECLEEHFRRCGVKRVIQLLGSKFNSIMLKRLDVAFAWPNFY